MLSCSESVVFQLWHSFAQAQSFTCASNHDLSLISRTPPWIPSAQHFCFCSLGRFMLHHCVRLLPAQVPFSTLLISCLSESPGTCSKASPFVERATIGSDLGKSMMVAICFAWTPWMLPLCKQLTPWVCRNMTSFPWTCTRLSTSRSSSTTALFPTQHKFATSASSSQLVCLRNSRARLVGPWKRPLNSQTLRTCQIAACWWRWTLSVENGQHCWKPTSPCWRNFDSCSSEFHGLWKEKQHAKFLQVMQKLKSAGFKVAHVHGNNFVGTYRNGRFMLPRAVEVTLDASLPLLDKCHDPNYELLDRPNKIGDTDIVGMHTEPNMLELPVEAKHHKHWETHWETDRLRW